MYARQDYIQQFFQKVQSYYPMSNKAFDLLQKIIHFEEIKAGELLLPFGKIAKYKYFICQGAVIAYFIDEKGNLYNKNIFLENDIAGSMVSAILQKPSQFELQAVENSVIICIDYQKYRKLIEEHSEFKNFYIAYLEKNWVIDKEKREIAIVMQEASERYQKLLEQHPNLEKHISLKNIALHLGITPTQLSRIRKELKNSPPINICKDL
ncbi:MAG: Crp/Fnr family transcriptional regulator [Capnocytophaga sp.]|nr:Crp/Fnr family transcriptional regulator [Capnocytophaga sp.]